MIFQHTWPQVLSGQKTQTRRLIKDGEVGIYNDGIWYAVEHGNGRLKYQIEADYAIQPGRGKKSIGRIEITRIEQQDVRKITAQDVADEGLYSYVEFMRLWVSMYDKHLLKGRIGSVGKVLQTVDSLSSDIVKELFYETIHYRPARLYSAWVLHFELIEDYTKGETL